MTSILEPFSSKRVPNETGTVSVYASVNNHRTEETNQDFGGIESPDKSMNLTFKENSSGTYNLIASNENTKLSLLELSPEGNLAISESLTLKGSGSAVSITGVASEIIKDAITNDQTIPTTEAVIDYISSIPPPEPAPTNNTIYKALNTDEEVTVGFDENSDIFKIKTNKATTQQNYIAFSKDAFYSGLGIACPTLQGIKFNRSLNGKPVNSLYPSSELKSLYPNSITSTQQNILKNELDNVCPTVLYCNNHYVQKVGPLAISLKEIPLTPSTSPAQVLYQETIENNKIGIKSIEVTFNIEFQAASPTEFTKGDLFEIDISCIPIETGHIDTQSILLSQPEATSFRSMKCSCSFFYDPRGFTSISSFQLKITSDVKNCILAKSNSFNFSISFGLALINYV